MSAWGPNTDFGLSSEELREAVDTHLASHIGDYETAFSDEEGWAGQSTEDGPPIDVLVVPPEGERRFAYVATFGCAFQPLPADIYRERSVERRVEFVLAAQQTGDEEEQMRALNLAANTVRQFAKLVHLNGVKVEPGETVAFSSDPKPVYDDADFCGFAFITPRLPGPGFEHLLPANAELREPLLYIAPVPIHGKELEFGVDNGPEALSQLLVNAGVTEMIDLSRPCAVTTFPDLVKAATPTQVKPPAKKASRKEEAKVSENTGGNWSSPGAKRAVHQAQPRREPPKKRSLFSRLLAMIGIR